MERDKLPLFRQGALLIALSLTPISSVEGIGGTPIPPPITHLCLAPGNGHITAAFAAAPSASSYNLYWRTTPGVTKANGTKISGVTSGAPLSGFTNGTKYYVVVVAVSSAGESAESREFSVTPNATGLNPFPAPAVPANPQGTPGDHSITLAWDAVTGATGYVIYYGFTNPLDTSAAGLPAPLTRPSSPYSQTSLSPGVPFYYKMDAVNPSCEGPESAQFQAIPAAIPVTPTNVQAFAADSQIILSWTNSQYADTQNVYWGNAPTITKATATKIAGAANPYTHPGRTNGQNYCYIITGANTLGESAPSPAVCAIPTNAPPLKPAGFTAVGEDRKITLSWRAAQGATSYRLYWSNAPGVTPLTGTPIAVSGTSHPLSGLTNGLHYYFVLEPLNITIAGPITGQICATPNSWVSAPPPPPPTTNPAPTLNSLQPSAATVGDPALSVSFFGANFVSGAKVLINGTLYTPNGFTATQLQATLPASVLATPGALSIQIQNPDNQKSGAQTFTVAPIPEIRGFSNLSPVMRLTDILQVDAVGITQFTWSLKATSGDLASAPAAHAAAPGSFATSTPSNQLSLLTWPLLAGSYHLEVFGTNAAGRKSSTKPADFILAAADALSNIRVYPNPWRTDTARDQTVKFANLTPDATVKIFTLSGHWIKDVPNAGGRATWDLTDNSGSMVASGIYLYLITDSTGAKARGKFAVIR